MPTRYLIQQSDDNPLDLNRDGRVTVGELVTSVLVVAACIALGLGAVAFGVWSLAHRLPGWGRISVGIVILAVIAAAFLGTWRMLRYERAERESRTDRARARRFEDEDRGVTRGLAGENKQARINQADVDAAVWQMLSAYYKTGSLARGQVQGLSEPKWNMANKALKSANLRAGRSAKLQAETLDDAWRRYLEWRATAHSWIMADDREPIAQ